MRKQHAAPELGRVGLQQSHRRGSGDLPETVAPIPLQQPLLPLHSLVPLWMQALPPRPISLLAPVWQVPSQLQAPRGDQTHPGVA